MQSPKDNAPKKPSVMDWKQRRGTSISLGSIGQSALRPSLLNPPPVKAKAPPPKSKPSATPAQPKPAGEAAPPPPVSRAFMSGSLVPPRPLRTPPAPQPPATPPAQPPAARAAEPAPLPKPKPVVEPAAPEPAPAASSRTRASAPAPKTEPRPEPEVLAAAAAAAEPQPAAAPRRPAKNVRQFHAALAADARGQAAPAHGLFTRKNLLTGAAVAVVGALSFGGWWFMSHRGAPAAANGIGGAVARPASLAPTKAAPPETVADNSSASTSAVTEAPSQAADEVSSLVAERPAQRPQERPAGPPTNFGALAPKGVRPGAPTRAGRVVLADLPEAPDLGAATGRSEATTAPAAAPAPAPAAPPPVIRLPSSDEPFSTNTPNPDPGG